MSNYVGGTTETVNTGGKLEFPQIHKLKLQTITRDSYIQEIAKRIIGEERSVHMDLKTVYKIEDEHAVLHLDVVHSWKHGVYCELPDASLSCVYYSAIVTNPAVFKEMYVNGCNGLFGIFVPTGYFQTEELAWEYIKACQKYGKMWLVEAEIAEKEKKLEALRDEIKTKTCELEKKKVELEEIVNGLAK